MHRASTIDNLNTLKSVSLFLLYGVCIAGSVDVMPNIQKNPIIQEVHTKFGKRLGNNGH